MMFIHIWSETHGRYLRFTYYAGSGHKLVYKCYDVKGTIITLTIEEEDDEMPEMRQGRNGEVQ